MNDNRNMDSIIIGSVNSKLVYQLLAHGRWFSPGSPASFTTKTGRHDIAEILLKVALKHQKLNQNHSYQNIDNNNVYY
jgi:hypothetical protein